MVELSRDGFGRELSGRSGKDSARRGWHMAGGLFVLPNRLARALLLARHAMRLWESA